MPFISVSSQPVTPPGASRWPRWLPVLLYGAFALVFGASLIAMSQHIVFRDFGDFSRIVGFMVLLLPEKTDMQWPFIASGIGQIDNFDLSSNVFGLFGEIQSWYSDYFDMRITAVAAKLVLLVYAHLLANELSRHFRHRMRARWVAFVALCLSMFAAHNSGMLMSFYTESTFFMFVPMLLYGFMCSSERSGRAALVLGALLCGVTKVQYFYMPALAIGCLLVANKLVGERHSRWTLGLLLAAQMVCVVPLANNPYAELNHHQSTYFGSYLTLSPSQLRRLGLSERQLACVGIDGWGHRALGPGGSTPAFVGHSCYGSQHIGMADVLAPYAVYPLVLPRLMAYALPAHFTTRYFHVYQTLPYLASANGTSFRSGSFLVKWSAWREKTVTRFWALLVLAGLAMPFLKRLRQHGHLSGASLFLSLFILSQMVVCLLGEGVRDLSKHLWAAQLALDFLVLVLLAQLAFWWVGSRSGPLHPSGPPSPTGMPQTASGAAP